jgi:hypothetical protein
MIRFTTPAGLSSYVAGLELMKEAIALGIVQYWGEYNGIDWYVTDAIPATDLIGCGFYVLRPY